MCHNSSYVLSFYIKKNKLKYGAFFIFESWLGGRWTLSYEYNVDTDKRWTRLHLGACSVDIHCLQPINKEMSSRRPCPDPFNVSLSHKHIISYSVKYALTGGENPIALTEMSIVIKNVSTVGCHIWGPGPRFFFFLSAQ